MRRMNSFPWWLSTPQACESLAEEKNRSDFEADFGSCWNTGSPAKEWGNWLIFLDWKQPSENFNTISQQFFLECKSRISPPLIPRIQCLERHHHWRRLPRKCPHWSEPIREEGCSLERWNVPWEDVDWPDELCCLATTHCSKSSRPCSPVWRPNVCFLFPIPHLTGRKTWKGEN